MGRILAAHGPHRRLTGRPANMEDVLAAMHLELHGPTLGELYAKHVVNRRAAWTRRPLIADASHAAQQPGAAGAQHTNAAAPPSPPSSTPAKPPAAAATSPSTPARNGTSTTTTPATATSASRHASCNLRDGANKTNGRDPPSSSSPTGGHDAGATTRPSAPSARRRTQSRDLRRQRRMAAAG